MKLVLVSATIQRRNVKNILPDSVILLSPSKENLPGRMIYPPPELRGTLRMFGTPDGTKVSCITLPVAQVLLQRPLRRSDRPGDLVDNLRSTMLELWTIIPQLPWMASIRTFTTSRVRLGSM